MKSFIIMMLMSSTVSIIPMMSRSKVMPLLSMSHLRKQCMTTIISSESKEIKAGELYRHYKGNLYEVLEVARYSEDPAVKFVVYKALYFSSKFGENSVWARPYAMFSEKVKIDGKEVDRFEKIGEVCRK